ncbi:hypothetical protein FQZ97_796720 [compost metagenome]
MRQLFLRQRGVGNGAEDVTHIGLLQHQRRDDLRRVQRLVVHHHGRMFLAEQAHGPGKYLVAQRQHGEHTQLALAAPGLEAGREALHIFELVEEAFDVRIKRLRLHRRPQPPALALEELEAELQLGVLQRAADGRLRDVDHAGRRTHAAGEHDGVENFDVSEAHATLWRQRQAFPPEHRGTGFARPQVLPPEGG